MKGSGIEVPARLYRLGGSFAVTLPQAWVKSNGLQPGESLTMEYDGRMVTIRPRKKT